MDGYYSARVGCGCLYLLFVLLAILVAVHFVFKFW